MKKAKTDRAVDILPQYDFRNGVRGKYAKRYGAGNNVVVLSPEVAEVFPTSESVNEALRAIVKIARKRTSKRRSV